MFFCIVYVFVYVQYTLGTRLTEKQRYTSTQCTYTLVSDNFVRCTPVSEPQRLSLMNIQCVAGLR